MENVWLVFWRWVRLQLSVVLVLLVFLSLLSLSSFCQAQATCGTRANKCGLQDGRGACIATLFNGVKAYSPGQTSNQCVCADPYVPPDCHGECEIQISLNICYLWFLLAWLASFLPYLWRLTISTKWCYSLIHTYTCILCIQKVSWLHNNSVITLISDTFTLFFILIWDFQHKIYDVFYSMALLLLLSFFSISRKKKHSK